MPLPMMPGVSIVSTGATAALVRDGEDAEKRTPYCLSLLCSIVFPNSFFY